MSVLLFGGGLDVCMFDVCTIFVSVWSITGEGGVVQRKVRKSVCYETSDLVRVGRTFSSGII